MKTQILLLLIIFTLGCSKTTIPFTEVQDESFIITNSVKDNSGYRLIILKDGYHQWFLENSKPASFYSDEYYMHRNRVYTRSWNELYEISGGIKPFNKYISYEDIKSYGPDFNYQLFWFFKFIEAEYGSSYSFPASASLD